MAFKMNGSPAKLGTIQGTSGHASALKQAKEAGELSDKEKLEALTLTNKIAAQQKLIDERNELEEEKKKKAKKKEVKKELKEKGVKDESGNYITTQKSGGFGMLSGTSDLKPKDVLSPEAKKLAEKKNKKKLKETQAEEEKEKKRLAGRSEKTKRLELEVKGSDFKTEEMRKRVDKAADIDAMTRGERNEARRKGELGYLGKGLFGGKLKRKRAQKKYEKQQDKEDKSREKLAESEVWDTLTPDEKIAKRREKLAFITAQFTDQSSVMANIAGTKTTQAQIGQRTEDPGKSELKKTKPFSQLNPYHWENIEIKNADRHNIKKQ